MYRPRLRKKTGCLRCRQRRKQCDESKPLCGFCAKWRIPCVWPDDQSGAIDKSDNDEGHIDILVPTHSNVSTVVTTCPWPVASIAPGIRTSLDPFHVLPLPRVSNVPLAVECIQRFFMVVIGDNTAFDVSNERSKIARGWLESIHEDEAACAALLAYRAKSTSGVRSSACQLLGMESSQRTVSLLRERVQYSAQVTEGTLLAAALHLAAFAVDLIQGERSKYRSMMFGVTALLRAAGGIARVQREMRTSTVLSLTLCDLLNSFLNAVRPSLSIAKPVMPQSFGESVFDGCTSLQYLYGLHGDVVHVLHDLRFLLYHRHPSRFHRSLTRSEAKYISDLGLWLEYQLGLLQACHLGQHSLSEVIVYAIIVAKLDIVAERADHRLVISVLLQRLTKAISLCEDQSTASHETLIIWASMIALISTPTATQRIFLLNLVHSILQTRHEMVQSCTWPDYLIDELKKVAWHDRMNLGYETICNDIQRKGAHPGDENVEKSSCSSANCLRQ